MENSAKYLIEQDLMRYNLPENFGFRVFLKYMFIRVYPGVRFSIIFRLCQHYRYKRRLLFYMYFVWLRHLKYHYGIDISYRTIIGKGLYIGHVGGIVIHGDTIIGENFTLSQNVTVGVLNRGKMAGIPKFGDSVFVGPGAVVLGGISIGDDVLIGANAVVNFNVPSHSVVAAQTSVVISDKGTQDYVINKV